MNVDVFLVMLPQTILAFGHNYFWYVDRHLSVNAAGHIDIAKDANDVIYLQSLMLFIMVITFTYIHIDTYLVTEQQIKVLSFSSR